VDDFLKQVLKNDAPTHVVFPYCYINFGKEIPRFWSSKNNVTVTLSKLPDDKTLHLCLRMKGTKNLEEVNDIAPTACFDIYDASRQPIVFPSIETCMVFAGVFLDAAPEILRNTKIHPQHFPISVRVASLLIDKSS
jgi:hypothetical protein